MKATITSLCKTAIFLLAPVLLASCVSVDLEPQVSAVPDFVTATLAPTSAGVARATSLPSLEVAFETLPAPIPAITAFSDCKDAAVLLRDVTIPDGAQLMAGEKFIKTWEFQNTGTCPWINYVLKFSSGDEVNAPLSIPMPAAVPNEKVQVSMELTAPLADGWYAAHFALYNPSGEIVPIGTEKTFWVKFVVGTYASPPVAWVTNSSQLGNCIHSQNADYVSQIISLINAGRTSAGLPVLTINSKIAVFAQNHAEDMGFNNFLSHDGSDGSFGERMAGFSATHSGSHITGEILAIGTPQNAMDQWRRDEHWDYVLDDFTQIGVGYAYNSCSDYGGYFTVDLSK